MSARDLTQIPMTAWGRHELEAEVKRLQGEHLAPSEPCQHGGQQLIESYYSDTRWCPACGAAQGTDGQYGGETNSWQIPEIVAEAQRLRARITTLEQTGGACSACAGSGRRPLALGACGPCAGSGHRARQVEALLHQLERARVACDEASRKATDHARQRDEARTELALRKPPPSRHKK